MTNSSQTPDGQRATRPRVRRLRPPPTPTSSMLISGEYFDHLAPDPAVITIDVLEAGLPRARFGGHTIRDISVAEHSLRVARFSEQMLDPAFDMPGDVRVVEIEAYIHDGHEAFTPWGDCLRPGKTDHMRKVEKRIDVAIHEALGLKLPGPRIRYLVGQADNLALYYEAMLWTPGGQCWAPALIADMDPQLVLDMLPLAAPRPGEVWATSLRAAIDLEPRT